MSDAEIKELVEQIWVFFDEDGNGILDAEESQKLIEELCEKGTKLYGFKDDLMKLIDDDGSKTLTKEELITAIKKGVLEGNL